MPENASSPPPLLLDARFLRRTLWATLVTLGLVALMTSVYGAPKWGAWFAASGLWALVFFAMTPPLVAALGRHSGHGRVGIWLLGKLVWTVALMAGLVFALRLDAAFLSGSGAWALLGGLGTPLAVVTLRVLGARM